MIPRTDYRAARIARGTQRAVARALGVDPQTISRRERGEIPVTREAWLALLSLPLPSPGPADIRGHPPSPTLARPRG